MNKLVVIFSPWPILSKQEMLLKSCMNFISHSFPNRLSLFLPKVVNPSRLLFLLSLHHHQRNRLSSNSSSLIISSLMLVLSLVPQLLEPKEERISSREFVMSQLKVSLPTFGLGENMAKNPLKAPPIQGVITDVAVQRGAWPGNKWSETDPTPVCS